MAVKSRMQHIELLKQRQQGWGSFLLISSLLGILLALLIVIAKPDWFPAAHRWVDILNSTSISADPLNHTANAHSGLGVGPVSYADAVGNAAPSVVNIYTTRIVQRKLPPLFNDPIFRRFFDQGLTQRRMNSSLGSGVIMDKAGYILTNHHVVNGADEIVVALHDGREAQAHLVGSDPDIDLAVLKVDIDNLPSVIISKAENIRIGDVVLAIGNPFGVGQTVTMGIISATGRNQLGLNTYENYIQTDAAINPGNSGGALINAHGELVGINTAIYSRSGGSQGIGFAIPASISAQVMYDIARYGRTIRGWMGIEVQETTSALLKHLQLPQALKGLIVTGLAPNGPSQRAGLKMGDLIIGLNGNTRLTAKAAMNQIAALRPGDTIDIDYIREGKTFMVTAVAGELNQ